METIAESSWSGDGARRRWRAPSSVAERHVLPKRSSSNGLPPSTVIIISEAPRDAATHAVVADELDARVVLRDRKIDAEIDGEARTPRSRDARSHEDGRDARVLGVLAVQRIGPLVLPG